MSRALVAHAVAHAAAGIGVGVAAARVCGAAYGAPHASAFERVLVVGAALGVAGAFAADARYYVARRARVFADGVGAAALRVVAAYTMVAYTFAAFVLALLGAPSARRELVALAAALAGALAVRAAAPYVDAHAHRRRRAPVRLDDDTIEYVSELDDDDE